MNFKIGQKVKCINDGCSNGYLQVGKIFTIQKIDRGCFKLSEMADIWWLMNRFVLVDSDNNDPICMD
jgi:hypothetical protein